MHSHGGENNDKEETKEKAAPVPEFHKVTNLDDLMSMMKFEPVASSNQPATTTTASAFDVFDIGQKLDTEEARGAGDDEEADGFGDFGDFDDGNKAADGGDGVGEGDDWGAFGTGDDAGAGDKKEEKEDDGDDDDFADF